MDPISSTEYRANTKAFLGVGQIILRDYDDVESGYFSMGNCSQNEPKIDINRTSIANFMTAAGGEAEAFEDVKSFTGSAKGFSWGPEHQEILWRGSVVQIPSGEAVEEYAFLHAGTDIPCGYIPDPSAPMTVTLDVETVAVNADYRLNAVRQPPTANGHYYRCTKEGNAGATPDTAVWPTNAGSVTVGTCEFTDLGALPVLSDADYSRSKWGLRTVAKPAWANGTRVKLAYKKNRGYQVQMIVNSGKPYEMVILGANKMDSGNPYMARHFRVTFGVVQGFPYIGDKPAEWQLNYTVTPDPLRDGNGLSAYGEFVGVL